MKRSTSRVLVQLAFFSPTVTSWLFFTVRFGSLSKYLYLLVTPWTCKTISEIWLLHVTKQYSLASDDGRLGKGQFSQYAMHETRRDGHNWNTFYYSSTRSNSNYRKSFSHLNLEKDLQLKKELSNLSLSTRSLQP